MNVLDRRWFRFAARLLVVAAVLGLWQYVAAAGVLGADAFPTMTGTMTQLGHELESGELWQAIWDTVRGWGLGLLVGCSLAIVVGTLLGPNRFAYLSVIPVIEFLKTVPVIAILPLAIVVWGATRR